MRWTIMGIPIIVHLAAEIVSVIIMGATSITKWMQRAMLKTMAVKMPARMDPIIVAS